MNQALFHGDLVHSKRIIYTPSLFAKFSLLHLQEIGELEAQKPHLCKRTALASYLFFVVLSGSGVLDYQNTRYSLSAGDCVFINCQNTYFHQTSDDLWQLQWIHFYGPTMDIIYDKYEKRGGLPCFHPSSLSRFLNLWDNLYETASTDDHFRDMRINEALSSLLTLLMEENRFSNPQHNSPQKQNLENIKKYLDDHYTEKITLDHLSQIFFINKFYLTRIFREQYGVSIQNYLLQSKITHAKHLLRFTDKTVEAIGLECGMGAVYYFSRMFKKVEGIAPSEYRKLWQN